MGVNPLKRSFASYDKTPPPGNPDPKNYKVIKLYASGGHVVAKISYPDCTNYEGVKILVFRTDVAKLLSQKQIDPHFHEDDRYLSPVARFVPTEEGWAMAVSLADSLSGTRRT